MWGRGRRGEGREHIPRRLVGYECRPVSEARGVPEAARASGNAVAPSERGVPCRAPVGVGGKRGKGGLFLLVETPSKVFLFLPFFRREK